MVMSVSIVDFRVAVQQREWERALIERKNRMVRAAANPLAPPSRPGRLVAFVRRNRGAVIDPVRPDGAGKAAA